MGEIKKRLKTEGNFTIYSTMKHNKCVIRSKLISVAKHLRGKKNGR